MDAAHAADIDRLLFLGSSCIYPRHATQPIRESSLMTGPLEPTNQAYAMAKISGIFYIEAHRTEYGRHWISAMPTNLYGPKDNFDLRDLARAAGVHPPLPRGQGRRAPRPSRSGEQARPAASSCTSTTSPRPA